MLDHGGVCLAARRSTASLAFGADFRGARRALAAVVWNAVSGGAAGIAADSVEAVRVLATTRKTFPVAELATDQS